MTITTTEFKLSKYTMTDIMHNTLDLLSTFSKVCQINFMEYIHDKLPVYELWYSYESNISQVTFNTKSVPHYTYTAYFTILDKGEYAGMRVLLNINMVEEQIVLPLYSENLHFRIPPPSIESVLLTNNIYIVILGNRPLSELSEKIKLPEKVMEYFYKEHEITHYAVNPMNTQEKVCYPIYIYEYKLPKIDLEENDKLISQMKRSLF